MVVSLVFIPCAFLAVLLFCCNDDFEKPKPMPARVATSDQPVQPAPKPKNKSLASLAKKEKAEKID